MNANKPTTSSSGRMRIAGAFSGERCLKWAAAAGLAILGIVTNGVGWQSSASEIIVDPSLSVQQLQEAVDSHDVVKFRAGTYTLTANNPNGAVLEISRSVRLIALDPAKKPVINIINTAFNGSNYEVKSIRARILEGALSRNVAFEHLVLSVNLPLSVVSCDNCDLVGCVVQKTGSNGTRYTGDGAVWFGADDVPPGSSPAYHNISGNISVINCQIVSNCGGAGLGFCQASDRTSGVSMTTISGTVTILDNDIVNQSGSGIFTGTYVLSDYCVGSFRISRNRIEAAIPIENDNVGGLVSVDQNKLVCTGYFGDWVSFGYFVRNTDQHNAFVSVTHNEIVLNSFREPWNLNAGLAVGAINPVTGVLFVGNRFYGRATFGVFMAASWMFGDVLPATDNTFVGNNFNGLDCDWGTFFLDWDATGNVIRGSSGRVVVMNDRNFITGLAPMSEAPHLGPGIRASMQAWRDGVPRE